MKRDKCAACGGTDMYESRMAANSGVILSRAGNRATLWGAVMVQSVACLTCGTVVPFVDDKGISKLRDWKAVDSHQVAGASGSDVPKSYDAGNLKLLVVVIALLAILAAVVIPMLNVAEKIK
jgi:hypothetical protein